MSFVLEYEYRFKEEVEREAGMQAALAALEGTPEQQARKAALEREQDELFKARKEARRRGNASEVERITAKMKDVSRKQDALDQEIMTAYSSKAFSGEMQREMGRGLPASNRVSVRVRVNPYHRVNAYAGDEAAPVGGGAQAFWTRYGVDHVEALLGGWKSTADNKFRRFEPVFELSVSQTQVQAVSIQIQPRKSDRETAEGLLRQFDLRALQALLN